MKTFQFAIDPEELNMSDEEKKFVEANGFNSIFENVLNYAFQSRYPQGIGGVIQRAYGRILAKLDDCWSGKIEIEEGEFEILKNLFTHDDAKFPPSQTRLIFKYIKQLDELSK